MRDFVHEFNTTQDEVLVNLVVIREDVYHDVLQQAADAGDLPDLLEFDSPFLANYVWQGHLAPMDEMLPDEIKRDLLPSVLDQGTYQGSLYAAGLYDNGLGIYLNPAKLRTVKARLPRAPADAWSADEFEKLLEALFQESGGEPVLDLKVNYGNDWFFYAFYPLLVSAGVEFPNGDRVTGAEGVINSPEAVAAMSRLQSWFEKGYVDPNEENDAFTQGRVALSWSGQWDYGRNEDELGGGVMAAPLPDFGHGSRTAQGAWTWGLTSTSRHPEAAMRFLIFMLQPENVLRMTEANGAIPSRQSVIGRSSYFGEGAPLHLFVRQLRETAVARPKTPAYPALMRGFEEAFAEIRGGADVQATLDNLARKIDEEMAGHNGYLSQPGTPDAG